MDQKQLLESRIELLGYFSHKLKQGTQINPHTSDLVDDCIRSTSHRKQQTSSFTPLNIATETNCIAIVDKENKGWLITDFLSQPISLSDLLKLKIFKIALGYNQLIASTKEGCLLVIWGNKKPLNETDLSVFTINGKHKYSHLFEVYKIEETSKKDFFMFSAVKKASDEHSLFSVPHSNPSELNIYPEKIKINFKNKINGISVGKYHKLCWDDMGRLYSWGCKSLALGHELLSEEDQVKSPLQVFNIRGFVLKAYAGINYSLAITLEGKLYEWGVKKRFQQNDQLIFQPRQIKIPNGQKLIDLKGRGERFGALTLLGELYIWGKNMKQHLPKQESRILESDESIRVPTLFDHKHGQIIDFSISEGAIGLVIANRRCTNISECQNIYWQNLKQKIGGHLKPSERQHSQKKFSQKDIKVERGSLRTSGSIGRFPDPIEYAFHKRIAKDNYIVSANKEDDVVNFIMRPEAQKTHTKMNSQISERNLRIDKKHHQQVKIRKSVKRFNTDCSELFKQCQKRKENIAVLQSSVYALQSRKIKYRFAKGDDQSRYFLNQTAQSKYDKKWKQKSVNKSYNERLEEVMKKKQEIHNMFFQKTARRLKQNSCEVRMKKRIQMEEIKNRKKDTQICQKTFQKVLVKCFISKLLTQTASEGRQQKINNLASTLKLKRLEQSIRSVFVKNRIKIKMKNLFRNQIFRYSILSITFRKYIRRFRQNKYFRMRKLVTQELFKSVIKDKMRLGLSACTLNIRKIQKFREWVAMVKAERKKCLKYMWKVYIFSMMKINWNNEMASVFYIPKKMQELSFQTIYQDKVAVNPLLKLSNFLLKHSIFRVKAISFQKLVSVFSLDKKNTREREEEMYDYQLNEPRKKCRIKFYEDEEDKFNLMQQDILPYSIHYNLLLHPKNYDIMIPEIMKQNQRWVKEQKKIFEKHIQLILIESIKFYKKQKKKYDIDLAHFIRKNYDSLSQKRWKYILQYNKTKRSFEKDKKQHELRRLLKMVNAEKKVDNDCLPEKYLILEEALKRNEGPEVPNGNISFTQSDFRRHFKKYFQTLLEQVKEIRRSFF